MQVKLLTSCLELDSGQTWQVEVMLADLLVTCMQSVHVYISCKHDTNMDGMLGSSQQSNASRWMVHHIKKTLAMVMQQTKIQSVIQQDLHNYGSFQDAAYGASCQKRFRFPNFHM